MPLLNSLKTLTLLLCVWLFITWSEASVHEYGGERFVSKGNAFVVHGGSEGIYASLPNQKDLSTSSSSSNGDSYIR